MPHTNPTSAPQPESAQAAQLRAEVARDYAHKAEGVGCGRAAPSHTPGAYSAADTAALPDDALASSFGCGNPLAFSGVRPGDTVVDLGSGAGMDLIIASQRTGPSGHVIGIDMTDTMIAKAQKNLAAAGATNAEVRKGIIEALPVADGSVDWVISNCVVNLSPEKPRVFREVARVLRPGGQMLISDIVVDDAPSWVRAIIGRVNRSVAGALGESAYLDGLRAAGLENVAIRARYVYDRASIEGMLDSELSDGLARTGLPSAIRDIATRAGKPLVTAIAGAVAGKVASVQVYAQKPGSANAPS